MTTSTHRCEVVKIDKFESIPNADRIVVAWVFGGYPCVVPKEQAEGTDLWVYIPPDSLVPTSRPEFSFLRSESHPERTHERIRTRKFRGQQSFGLLIPLTHKANPGDDLAEKLGVTHYEPPQQGEGTPPKDGIPRIFRIILRRSLKHGQKPPRIRPPYYDIESLRRYPDLLEGRTVVYMEKIHGANACYTWEDRGWVNGIVWKWPPRVDPIKRYLHMRSRTVWKDPLAHSWWSEAMHSNMEVFLRDNPGTVLFGEVYGQGVQNLTYGADKPTFVAFDLWEPERGFYDFLDFLSVARDYNLPVPPNRVDIYDFDLACFLAEGGSDLGGNHVREGIVIRTLEEEVVPPIGRAQLKLVGEGYYERT